MQNRIIRTKNVDDFKRFIMRKYHDIETEIKDPHLKQALSKLSIGCFVIVYEDADKSIEPLVMHKFVNNLSSMIAKENLFSLHMRYLSQEERAQCATVID